MSSIQCKEWDTITIYNVHCTMYNVQCTSYILIMLEGNNE